MVSGRRAKRERREQWPGRELLQRQPLTMTRDADGGWWWAVRRGQEVLERYRARTWEPPEEVVRVSGQAGYNPPTRYQVVQVLPGSLEEFAMPGMFAHPVDAAQATRLPPGSMGQLAALVGVIRPTHVGSLLAALHGHDPQRYGETVGRVVRLDDRS